MNNNLLRLEYDKIINILSSYCKTYKGIDLSQNLLPMFNYEQVLLNLNETKEAVELYSKNGSLPIYEIKDISIWLKFLNSNQILTTSALLELNNVLKTADALKEYFNKANLPNLTLKEYFSNLYSNKSIEKKVTDSILSDDTIADIASKKLFSIRKNKIGISLKIKDTLNKIIHSQTYSKYLMEPIVTMKNNRFVIPVKIEHKKIIKGFTHDISSSGSTVFIEPLQVFELNNDLNSLLIEEEIEIQNILKNLGLLFKDYIVQLKNNIELIGKLDFIFAKATFAIKTDSNFPHLTKNKTIELKQARHPLLPIEKVVPIDFYIGNDFSSLIITGPNTGGKTVALKTIGLLCLMAYSGLFIPAKEDSSLFVFDNIFADIGDEQSIQESLSTFSSHITNIISICNNATEKSLILLDELGSGTDPIEGANLALSILEYFFSLNATTISTSHFTELKNYGLVTKGFKNACFEFDIKTLKPTYKLLIGIPGKSNALEISAKLGLKDSIIKSAYKLQTKESINIEDLLKKINDTKLEIEEEKKKILMLSKEIQNSKISIEKEKEELNIAKKEFIEKNKSAAQSILLKAKENADRIIQSMNSIASKSSLKEANDFRKELNHLINSVSTKNNEETQTYIPLKKEDISVNSSVLVHSLNQIGTVLSLPNKSNEVLVEVGNMKIFENIENLSINTKNSTKTNEKTSTITKLSHKKNLDKINIIGLTIDEALPLVDKYLDDCAVSKIEFARIIHGKGSGKLRTGIHAFLKKNKHVKTYRMGTFGEGEMGVTIITLKGI